MSKSEPVKTELMKFVTMRSPQLIDQETSKRGYIRHPQPSESAFLKRISGVVDLGSSREKVREALKDFNHVATYEDLIKINMALYQFSEWLAKEQNGLTLERCKEQAKEINLLSANEVYKVWDNLFYQVVTRASEAIRQAAMRLLVGQNFIEKLRDPAIEATAQVLVKGPKNPLPPEGDELMALYLQRVAASKVIMPQAFSVEKKKVKLSKKDLFPKFDTVRQKHLTGIAEKRLKKLELADKDLEKHRTAYTKKKRSARAQAEEEYNKEILKLSLSVGNKAGASARARRRGVQPNALQPEILIPKFAFNFKGPFAKEHRKELNRATDRIIDRLGNEDSGIDEMQENIQKLIRTESNSLYGTIKGSKKVLRMHGGILSEERDPLYAYSISFTEDDIDEDISDKVLMTLEAGYKLSYPTAVKLTLSIQGDSKYVSSEVEIINNENEHLLLDLFPEQTIKRAGKGTFTLEGTMRLDNGTELVFDVNGRLKNQSTNGVATVVNEQEEDQVQLYGVNKVGVADFRKVEQELCCYVPGEVSHIENIMAKEYKERHTRTLIGSETSTEESSTYEQESVSDTTSTSRNELQKEVQKVMEASRNSSIGVNASVEGGIGTVKFSANASFNLDTSTSLSRSNNEAKTMAQEVTEKALERVVQSTATKRAFTMRREFEENNRHGFDNREGDKHVSGVYRWVDKIYTNRLINYGKRLMYEFMIPEPARFYKKAIEERQEENPLISVIEKPKHPSELALRSAADIKRSNYRTFASAYGIHIEAPEAKTQAISQPFTSTTPPKNEPFDEAYEIYLPPNYLAQSAEVSANVVYKGQKSEFNFVIGEQRDIKTFKEQGAEDKEENTDGFFHDDYTFEMPISDKVGVTIMGNKISAFTVAVTIKCILKSEAFEQWQNQAYEAIMQAYNDKIAAYENSRLTAEITQDQDKERQASNTAFNREVEIRELKRSCIEMITQPFDIPMGKKFHRKGDHDIPEIKQNQELEEYASHVKFFEQAFEWDVMAYIFYPYYWAPKKKWQEMFQLEGSTDSVFQAFLQSGMARVVVPVRPGFEEAISYYMETGDIWNGGGLVLDSDDDLYLSIAEEMKTLEGVVEEEWQTRVPSTLTIIQNSSVGLNAEGLPCCDEGMAGAFEKSEVTLGRLKS